MRCFGRSVVAPYARQSLLSIRLASSGSSGKQNEHGFADGDNSASESGRPDSTYSQQTPPPSASQGASRGWLGKILQGQARVLDTGHESHSRKLAKKGVIYEMQTHSVKPDHRNEYLKTYEEFVKKVTGDNKKIPASLVGSFMVESGGDQDQAVHIWRHSNGYLSFDQTLKALREDKDLQKLQEQVGKCLRSRQNQAMLSFSYWGDPLPHPEKRIYELRTYTLKPGTLIEWGNHWARAIHLRKSREDGVGGFFTQIGPLYIVHHIWAYTDLEARKEARDAAWSSPGWDDCVANTVPLVREMNSKILVGNPFSPMK